LGADDENPNPNFNLRPGRSRLADWKDVIPFLFLLLIRFISPLCRKCGKIEMLRGIDELCEQKRRINAEYVRAETKKRITFI